MTPESSSDKKARDVVHAWIRDDTNITLKLTATPEMYQRLIDRIVEAFGK